jgi:SET domain-containing protein
MSHINIDGEIIRTPLGGFYNHSETPNCIKYEKDNRFYLKTISDIEEGEELTVKYTLYNIE